MGRGFSAWVAKQRRSVLIPHLRKKRDSGFRSFISTPLVSGDTLIGVLNLGHEEPDAFNESHMEFLEIIAAQLAHTIEHDLIQRRLIEKNEELVKAREEIEAQQQKIIEMGKMQTFAQMAVSINHEINNPLTSVLGNIELILMMNHGLDEKTKKRLVTIRQEASRISDIVEKLGNAKKVVTSDYLGRYGEKMIDIEKSSHQDDEEKLSL